MVYVSMETQKIVNLLNDSGNESSNLQRESGMISMIKITQNMVKEMKMIQELNLNQKLSNQVFGIIQMNIFL